MSLMFPEFLSAIKTQMLIADAKSLLKFADKVSDAG